VLELAAENPPFSERMCCICRNKSELGELGEWKKRRESWKETARGKGGGGECMVECKGSGER
jgi:hypothetical protein